MKKLLLVNMVVILGLLAACTSVPQETELEEAEPAAMLPPTASPTSVPPTESPTTLPPTSTPYPAPAFAPDTLAYELPGMAEVEVESVQYGSFDGGPLTADLYYPLDGESASGFPVVIFVSGFKNSGGFHLRVFAPFTAWGRLVAVEGMVGVLYDTSDRPDADLEALIAYLEDNATTLGIDRDRMGLWANSSNVPTALSYVMQPEEEVASFAVLYYGDMLTPDNYMREEINSDCELVGCYAAELKDVPSIRTDLPLLIVRAGFDDYSSSLIDHFVEVAGSDAPITLIDYEVGWHAFDFEQKTEASADVIEQTVVFMKSELEAS